MKKEKLYYTDSVPTKVHVVSDKLFLDHVFEPIKEKQKVIHISELFSLCENPIFDTVGVLLTPENKAYLKSIDNKISMKEWVDLKLFDGIELEQKNHRQD